MNAMRRFRFELGDDSGVALSMVMVVTAILFIIATMLLTVAVNEELITHRYAERIEAMHLADAGLNAYLYELRRDPRYYIDNPTLGPTTTPNGSWEASATPPQGGEPLTIRSVGTLSPSDRSRTVVATVRFPTFADYMFLAVSEIRIGAAATIYGRVRSNSWVHNDGHVHGLVQAHEYVTGSGTFEQGYEEGAPAVDFAQVSADLDAIRQVADSIGTYRGPSGRRGYRVTFLSGSRVRIERVTHENTTSGVLTTDSSETISIPAEGVFYFHDKVWVSGTYSDKVTIASSDDIYIPDHLEPFDMNSRATCGLIAQGNIVVPTWYANLPENMRLTAAMLAQTGNIYGGDWNQLPRRVKNSIHIIGSLAYRDRSYMATVNQAGTVLAGFRTRQYDYDYRFDLDPPPMYPQIRDGRLKVSTWVER